MEYQMYNWYYFVWLSGDHICEQHIHNLDVIQWVKQGKPYDPTGKTPIVHPVKVRGMGGRQVRTSKETGEIFDHHACQYEYGDGSDPVQRMPSHPQCWSSVSEHVVGTKGNCNVGSGVITGANAGALPARSAKAMTPTRSNTTISSTPSATTSPSTRPSSAPTAP
jgi:myo-inositol 2-dehydrogenase/D-chiro-inositol 1-dehydrogenase